MVSLFVVVLTAVQAFSSPYFTPLRDDTTVPELCYEMELGFFNLPYEKVFFGRKGALGMGYTNEYPVTRGNATILWRYFKKYVNGTSDQKLLDKIKKKPELLRDYRIIMREYEEQDFDFSNEGEILEVLAIHQLYQDFPENTYYITGGYEYHESHSSKTIGELDIFVGHRDNCSAVAIGEAKLGTRKMLNKAYKQIERFENFLRTHI